MKRMNRRASRSLLVILSSRPMQFVVQGPAGRVEAHQACDA